jgi:dienelactone hydrolase
MKRYGILFANVVCLSAAGVWAGQSLPWDREALFRAPQMYDAAEYATNGVKALFYESVPFKGRPTRVFAYTAMPTNVPPGQKVPGVVLVHGGGGSAFFKWVQLWTGRGYAAISMDTCGAISGQGYNNHTRHPDGGPAGWGGFDTVDGPAQDQWTYHAVSAVLLGHSLLRSFPEVDVKRVGITGISWGGYLTCIAAGVDDRFAFAVPVYGCGFLGDNSTWLGDFKGMGEARAKKWLALWDPSAYLPQAIMPFLWVTGSNDFAYPMDSLKKSYRSLKAPYTLCVRLRMPHGHGPAGENPKEIYAFAEHVVRGAADLPEITSLTREGRRVTLRFNPNQRVVARVELNYTADGGVWKARTWQSVAVEANACSGEVKAEIPSDAKVYYVNLFTDDDLAVSSEHDEL